MSADIDFATVVAQVAVQDVVSRLLVSNNDLELRRTAHALFAISSSLKLPSWAVSLDASRPWVCFWIVHSLSLLGQLHNQREICDNMIEFLSRCQDVNGGFAGGPAQLPHLATTYASIMTLCEIGTDEALRVINRRTLASFILARKDPSAGFTMHQGGEIDVRATYCALVSALTCRLESFCPQLFVGVANWVKQCQTYEGGFGGEPGNEAHGGYALCGIASLLLLGQLDKVTAKRSLRWAAMRQMSIEGGFQGRTNKLVDSCYSYWVGGIFPIVDSVLARQDCVRNWLFNADALQKYIVCCCQSLSGGIKDKPEKNPDLYHMCYSLSGMSIAEHQPRSLQHTEPQLRSINPVFNVTDEKLSKALYYFDNVDQ
uniref:Protein farnesyltransferase subunit beta n=1 Tax=Spongospora subterranea TaxID=70186 RepID=A0A0H5RBE2_9EUKA|eukprot:CRZ11126.1 hypothetical protein [Spongospora subterranea]